MSSVVDVSPHGVVLPYPDGGTELKEHILRVNGILRDAVQRFRSTHGIEQRSGLGRVAIFDEEIDQFLATFPSDTFRDTLRATSRRDEERRQCELRAAASLEFGIDLPIDTIRRRFGLGEIELDALMLCIARELDAGYGRVFGYLNNDLTRQNPTAALLIDVLSENWAERRETRRLLGAYATLFRCGLLAPSRPGFEHLSTELTIDPVVLELVLGSATGGNNLTSGNEIDLDDLLISPAERETIERTTGYLEQTVTDAVKPMIIVISGSPGVGRSTTAHAICRRQGYRFRSSGKDVPAAALTSNLSMWLRDARLANEIPGIYVPRSTSDEPPHLPACIEAVVAASCRLAFLFVDSEEPPPLGIIDSASLSGIHLSAPRAALRKEAWKRALDAQGLDCAEETISAIAAVYPFNVGRIYATARSAAAHSQVGALGARHTEMATLAQACREQTRHHLDRLAQKLPIRYGWNDIVLPPDELCRLKEIANAVRNRDCVMDEWGFGRKVCAGPGVNAIFFGASGTGKTMAASILAGDLGMAIYRVDLSRVVSKYIGETERNLDALFTEARRSFAFLFFDEAEALFGKRSEVKDAHDRYANIEIAYLLQRMEAFEGVAVLATNLRKNLDTAFLRRIQFAVEFPLPGIDERLRIWRQVWPEAADLSEDIDLEFMARNLELAGGHIRNIALMAAYLAAEGRRPITMAHVVAATRREFQKLGWHSVPEPFNSHVTAARGRG